MHTAVKTDERTIAQVIVLLRARVAAGHLDPPLSVALVVGTQAEAEAWRKEALDYLTAKAQGVQYLPSTVAFRDYDYDQGSGD